MSSEPGPEPEVELVAVDGSTVDEYSVFLVLSALLVLPSAVVYFVRRHHYVIRRRFPRLVLLYSGASAAIMFALFLVRSADSMELLGAQYQSWFFIAYHQRCLHLLGRWNNSRERRGSLRLALAARVPRCGGVRLSLSGRGRTALGALSAAGNVGFAVVSLLGRYGHIESEAHHLFNVLLLLPILALLNRLADSVGVKMEAMCGIASIILFEAVAHWLVSDATGEAEWSRSGAVFWANVVCLLCMWGVSVCWPLLLVHWDNRHKARWTRCRRKEEVRAFLTQRPFRRFCVSEGCEAAMRFYSEYCGVGMMQASLARGVRQEKLAEKLGISMEELAERAEAAHRTLRDDTLRRYLRPSVSQRFSQMLSSRVGSENAVTSASLRGSGKRSSPGSNNATVVMVSPRAVMLGVLPGEPLSPIPMSP